MAKYRVVEHPGFPGPRGFVRPGGTVTLPDDAVPSRSFIPLDKAAHEALTLAKMSYVEGREQRLAELDPPRKLNAKTKRELLFVPDVPEAPKAAEKAGGEEEGEEEGETISDVAARAGLVEAPTTAAARKGGKRAADE